jgi:hypothetical protein
MKDAMQEKNMPRLVKVEIGLLMLYTIVFGGVLVLGVEPTFGRTLQNSFLEAALVLFGEFLWFWVWGIVVEPWGKFVGILHILSGVVLFSLPIIGITKGRSRDRHIHLLFLGLMAIFHIIIDYQLLQVYEKFRAISTG